VQARKSKKSSAPGGARPKSPGLHPRNPHQGLYDFELLTQKSSQLKSFVLRSPRGELTIDFANPEGVKALNRALLKHYYGVSYWEIPKGFLCPPIPGRADYLHYLADLLASSNAGVIPRGPSCRVLDIGVGANCIYPLIGYFEYGWHFVGTDIDPAALRSAQEIIDCNSALKGHVDLRLQESRQEIFQGIFEDENEKFDLSMCNPPFHASLQEAQEGSQRKWKNLGRAPKNQILKSQSPALNFGGQKSELWCPGGEAAFVSRMIAESVLFSKNVFWFTSLISKEATLPILYKSLQKASVREVRTVDMAQGQKKSRFLCWTFLTPKQQDDWRKSCWVNSKSASV
jgi:23S rRNA (adenine1618-N6)-methyltransferase